MVVFSCGWISLVGFGGDCQCIGVLCGFSPSSLFVRRTYGCVGGMALGWVVGFGGLVWPHRCVAGAHVDVDSQHWFGVMLYVEVCWLRTAVGIRLVGGYGRTLVGAVTSPSDLF